MLRCVTSEKETLYASSCEESAIRQLAKDKKIYCPNCQTNVIFKKGKIMSAHFAHYNSECVVTNSEPETNSHINGKEILFSWLKQNFPTADVDSEVHIPETGQIADVFIQHREKGMEGLRWAFEFQHSPLSSTDWEKRHNLYQSEGIQDFWILDKATYMKFSIAKGITDARRRNELEKAIYNITGLCYFLDLETSELTIDFDFITRTEKKMIKGYERKTDYTYHSPILHSSHMNQIKIRMNEEFRHGVLIYKDIESRMERRLSWIIQKFKRKQKLQLEQEFQEQAIKKKTFAKDKYGQETADIFAKFIDDNKEELDIKSIQGIDIPLGYYELVEDIRNMQDHDFFDKYNDLIEKLSLNLQLFEKIKDGDDLINKIIGKINYSFQFYKLSFLIDQDSKTLQDYLISKDQEKINLVGYVYKEYKEVLEKLASMNPKYIKNELGKIKSSLSVWEDNPTALDYAIEYHRLKSKDEIDECIEQIKEKIINYNPFAGEDW
ncbi:competence protein CoiA [Peribacillus aracenensis]|uniref:competence protein CoiA n=1 Tax=Peribacillus aracenensis TaxID=2976708 RepID=UPI0021A38B46|nr:competence protein CoiA [Peribacillus sp. BBB004]